MNESEAKGCSFNFFPEGTIVRGDIVSDKDLILEGLVEGSVSSKAKVYIKSEGYVKGDISCDYFFCGGIVDGNVSVTNGCELNNKAIIKGNVQCATLNTNFDCIIEKGLRLKK